MDGIENSGNIMDVDKEYLDILLSSYKVMKLVQKTNCTKKMNKNYDNNIARMEKFFHNVIESKDTKFDNIVTLAQAYLYMANTCYYINEKEKFYMNSDNLIKSWLLLKDKMLDHKAILITVKIFNNLATIFYKHNQVKKCKAFLRKTLEQYSLYTKKKNEYPVPIHVSNILGIEAKIDTKSHLDTLYIYALEHLAIIYSTHAYLDHGKLTLYMHKALNKKLDNLKVLEKDYIGWAKIAAILSTYFILHGRFTEARNHLAAADFMMQKFYVEKYLKTDKQSPDYVSVSDNYESAITYVTMCWARYGIQLMYLSKQKLLYSKKYNMKNKAICLTESSTQSEKKFIPKFLTFTGIEKDLKLYISVITDKYLLNYNDAKTVFVNVLKWLNKVKEYNTSKRNMESNVEVMRNISKIYRYLAFFEQDICN